MTEEIQDREDTTFGGITWACSEEDGGPDVGISVFIGDNDRLWCGEISRNTFEQCCGSLYFASDGGWFIMRYAPDGPKLIAKCADPDEARELIEQIALWMKRST
jgi:hypothetical protein